MSSNKIFVNSKEIKKDEPHLLNSGDEIHIGDEPYIYSKQGPTRRGVNVFFILLLILAGIGLYYVSRNQSTPVTPTSTPTGASPYSTAVLADSPIAYYFTVPAGANILDGKWHYMVVTFDGSNATVYYDNHNLGTQAVSFNTALSSAGLVLGSRTGNNDSPYNGGLDEVAIYNKVLTPTQITAHYNASFQP